MTFGGQGHHNIGIRCPDWGRIAIREIDAAVGQTNIVDDVLDFAGWYLPSDRLLDLIAKVGRLFNAHSSGSTHMELESTAVHAGEEVPAQPGDQDYERTKTTREECNQEDAPMMETYLQQSAITAVKPLESALEALLKPDQRIADNGISRIPFFSAQQVFGHRRNDGPRKKIRGQHGENDGFCERHKEVPRHAG